MSLPDDLVREILSKITCIKLAVRLSCVCKSWREWTRLPDFFSSLPLSIIYKPGGDPHFTFHRRGGDQYQILTGGDPEIIRPLSLPQGLSLKVIGECNGILCIGNISFENNKESHQSLIYQSSRTRGHDYALLRPDHLYNPITRENRKLPPPGLPCSFSSYHLAYGFGFDKRGNDYKIIRFWKMPSTMMTMAEIYKLSTNCWTNLDVDLGFIHATSYFSIGSLYVNGSCYWLYNIYTPKSIVSFDLQTETFGHIKDITPLTPSYDGEYITTPDLGVLDDSLAICCVNKVHREFTEVWVMSENRNMESNWTKKFIINSSLNGNCCSWVHDVNLFQLDSGNGKLFACVIHEVGEAPKTRTRMFKANDRFCRSVVFKPSLVSLHGA